MNKQEFRDNYFINIQCYLFLVVTNFNQIQIEKKMFLFANQLIP